jgi:glycosyltransferase involved in cell wall biosynthesis
LKLWIKNQVIFIWYLEWYELASYYTQSAWVIFPLLYTSFPFSLNNALAFNTKILSSDIDEVQDILWEKAFYFSPISSIEMIKIMNDVSLLEKIEINYDEIKTKYSCENFITQLKMICQI